MVEHIESLLIAAVRELGHDYPSDVVVSEPPHHVASDYAVNVALQLARATKGNPRELAEQVKEKLMASGEFSSIDIAGPGFLNLHLDDAVFTRALADLLSRESLAGKPTDNPQKVVVEFVSANPTGPLHIGNARGGPIGETISRALEARGHTVHRDFYVNDIGGQARKFALSILHYYKLAFGQESEFPEGGYPAPYIQELASQIAEAEGESLLTLDGEEQIEAMRKTSIACMVQHMRATCDRMGITFTTWSPQSELETSGRATATLELLKEKDAILEKDGAIWLKSGIQDEDRETVLVKSDGTYTYFLDDTAFYRMKLEEWGNDTSVCVLGANHSGHIPRMQASMAALGLDPKRYQGTLYQQVQLKEGAERIKMSKREGNFVTADEVLDQVPRDVFTWFMLSKAAETHLDFDLQLAKDTSEKNPIYYVQYAHARIHSIIARAGEVPTDVSPVPLNAEERALVRHLSAFPHMVSEVAETFRTNLIPAYLYELATRYHHFYAHHRVMADEPAVFAQRLALSKYTASVLREGLKLMNIEAMEQMGRE
ncbi:MAG TPA: arginine--tRNA ligase [Verrucomicrobiae bacterium]|nr:arginine--tRNA ligase [Verrucomicrobiae bacterium]